MYDVTSVLEGVGLIEKIGFGRIKWIGCEFEGDDLISKIESLRFDNQLLEQKESQLDELLKVVKESLNKDIKEAVANKLAYVDVEDAGKSFKNCEALIAIEAPDGTKVRFKQSSFEESSDQEHLMLEERPTDNVVLREDDTNTENSENQNDPMMSGNDNVTKVCKINLDQGLENLAEVEVDSNKT